MKNEEYMKRLVGVGLLPREAKIYLALLTKNSFTATEIAKISGIPRQKIYEILDNIIKKGICVEKVGKIKRYKAVEPESVFRGLIEQYKEKEKAALELSNDLSALHEKNREKVDPLDYIEVLNDKKQIYRRWMTLQSETTQEILAFTKRPYSALFAKDNKAEIEALNRKINIRSIYEYKDIVKDELAKVISLWIDTGEEARIVEELPMKMIIFDEKITMFALNDPISLKPSITTMIIYHPSYAMAQKSLFESIWEKAIPFEEFKIKEKI